MTNTSKLLNLNLVLAFIGIVLTLIFNSTIICDEFEHLRMSWFVSQGEVPYRDFFEHHHPLIWYLFAPILLALPHNALLVFYTAKTFAFIAVLLTYYTIYLIIRRFLGGVTLVPYFFALLFTFYPIWYCSSIFKPDTFVRLFYFYGLYTFFCYLETQKLKNLIFCAISFTIAFLFLQTILFSIFPLIIPLGFYLYKNPRRFVDCLKACIIPFIILGSCVALLIHADTWQEYFQLCWIFNAHLFQLMHPDTSSIFWAWLPPTFLAFVYLLYQIKKHNLSYYQKIVGLLFICECINHILFPAVFAHYLILLFIFTSLILTHPLKEFLSSSTFKTYLYIYLFSMLVLNFITLSLKNNRQILPIFQQINQNQSDTIVIIDMNYVNIYAPKISYYSMFTDLHRVDDYLFHRLPKYNINTLIKKTNPKYLDYNSPASLEKDSRFYISKDILKKYQLIAPHLYQRIDTLQ